MVSLRGVETRAACYYTYSYILPDIAGSRKRLGWYVVPGTWYMLFIWVVPLVFNVVGSSTSTNAVDTRKGPERPPPG